jgi:hypothetical protein
LFNGVGIHHFRNPLQDFALFGHLPSFARSDSTKYSRMPLPGVGPVAEQALSDRD